MDWPEIWLRKRRQESQRPKVRPMVRGRLHDHSRQWPAHHQLAGVHRREDTFLVGMARNPWGRSRGRRFHHDYRRCRPTLNEAAGPCWCLRICEWPSRSRAAFTRRGSISPPRDRSRVPRSFGRPARLHDPLTRIEPLPGQSILDVLRTRPLSAHWPTTWPGSPKNTARLPRRSSRALPAARRSNSGCRTPGEEATVDCPSCGQTLRFGTRANE
jgi:hypothetical protein